MWRLCCVGQAQFGKLLHPLFRRRAVQEQGAMQDTEDNAERGEVATAAPADSQPPQRYTSPSMIPQITKVAQYKLADKCHRMHTIQEVHLTINSHLTCSRSPNLLSRNIYLLIVVNVSRYSCSACLVDQISVLASNVKRCGNLISSCVPKHC